MKRIVLFFAALALLAPSAYAGGYQVGEMATRAAGMGSAFTAVADDASAAWYNPAGVAFMDSNQLMLGGDVIITNNKYSSNAATKGALGTPLSGSANAGSKTFFVPHGYITYRDKNSKFGASLGINSPFGLETDWPATSPFAGFNTFSRINMVMVNPSVSYRINDRLAIAAGVDYVNVYKVDLNNTNQNLSGKGDGWGGNVSLLYKGDGFNFGITYRSRVKVNLNGTATAVPGGALATNFGATSSSAHTSITLPDQVNVGLAVMPNEQWTLSLDVDWVNWKTFNTINVTYDSGAYRGAIGGAALFVTDPIGYTINPLPVLAAIAAQSGSTNMPQNWKATVAYRLGAEWKYSKRARVRFGFVYDPTPINAADFSPAIPGNDRQLYCIGYGYDITPATTLDLGYSYVHIDNRNQTASPTTPVGAPASEKNGLYKGYANIIMASVNTRF